jgi:hypothetical protein
MPILTHFTCRVAGPERVSIFKFSAQKLAHVGVAVAVNQVPTTGERDSAAVNQFHRAVKSNSKSGDAQADGAHGHAKHSVAISEAIPLRGPESGAVGEINTAGEGSQILCVEEKREAGGCR